MSLPVDGVSQPLKPTGRWLESSNAQGFFGGVGGGGRECLRRGSLLFGCVCSGGDKFSDSNIMFDMKRLICGGCNSGEITLLMQHISAV